MKVEQIKIEEVVPAGYNPRKISDRDFDSLKASLKKFGFVDPIIINKRSSTLVGGHQRLKAAKELGMKEVPVTYVDLAPKMEKELNIRLNRNNGEWDHKALGEFFEPADLVGWGFETFEVGINDADYLADVEFKDEDFKESDLKRLGAELVLVMSPEVKDAFVKLLGTLKKANNLESQEDVIVFITKHFES